MANPIERLRQIWSPGSEVQEIVLSIEPQTELDSEIRDYLHRIIQQRCGGSVTLALGINGLPVLNTGVLRWEKVHFQPAPGAPVRHEVTIWIEQEEHGH